MAKSKKPRLGKWTRRGLITAGVLAGGTLVVGIAIRPGHRAPGLRDVVADPGEALLNLWVKIGPDNRATAIVPHAEMGQGVHTALAQMLADELDADWNLVDVEEAPAHAEYANHNLAKGFLFGDAEIPRALVGTVDGVVLKLTQAMDLQITGGSLSVRATGLHGMRVAGAAARQMLAKAAATAWEVPERELVLRNSHIRHEASGRTATYAEFAAAAAQIPPSSKPRLKDSKAFSLIGTSVKRQDVPAKVDGSAAFGIDAQLPDLKTATVRSCPVFGGRVAAVDESAVLRLPGVERVVNLGDAIAVVADGYWHANRGLAALAIEWSTNGRDALDQAGVFTQFDRALAQAEIDDAGDVEVDQGDCEAALAGASRRLEAEYRVPYLAHAAMEPMNCTAWLHDGVCEIWTGTQNPLGARTAAADAIGFEPDNVIVHNAYLGGAFGRRSVHDYVVQAVRVAKAANAPTKLIWSREEDIAQDRYRPAVTSRFRAGLDDRGRPVVWTNLYVDKHEPAEAPRIPYAIDNQRIASMPSPTHVPFGVWRAVDHSQHAFFTESFIDELAVLANADPYRFRHDLLVHKPRHRKVLDAAAEAAGWGVASGPGRGRGIALHESFGSIVAEVVDARVDAGNVRVERVVCAIDAGYAVNPDGLAAQMESGIVYGLTAALYGEISLEKGRVKQSNFHDYPMLRIDEMPEIETVIVNSGGPLGGAGEPGTPPVAPALANAIHNEIGVRIRELPISKHDLNV
ncbi:MAG: xanthine dehydrogenase family protein molybdopterin-binding subunit [Gammaproteobacteria bacterium]|nr:xanthine dehydrogenase family protein molybdopterin-binding subunit [Gammaproteobacteria bacterium]MYF28281.1 xanthine dehydrogenase family protein molybdopterin-binding subunit [Gammaproteobacteria bacterium]MYK47295.1 xanthine dehydrogenase family protein molybdopterin-binding subunit [Gammaproteobacteria bacterium]